MPSVFAASSSPRNSTRMSLTEQDLLVYGMALVIVLVIWIWFALTR